MRRRPGHPRTRASALSGRNDARQACADAACHESFKRDSASISQPRDLRSQRCAPSPQDRTVHPIVLFRLEEASRDTGSRNLGALAPSSVAISTRRAFASNRSRATSRSAVGAPAATVDGHAVPAKLLGEHAHGCSTETPATNSTCSILGHAPASSQWTERVHASPAPVRERSRSVAEHLVQDLDPLSVRAVYRERSSQDEIAPSRSADGRTARTHTRQR